MLDSYLDSRMVLYLKAFHLLQARDSQLTLSSLDLVGLLVDEPQYHQSDI